jgi:hypothetical protein
VWHSTLGFRSEWAAAETCGPGAVLAREAENVNAMPAAEWVGAVVVPIRNGEGGLEVLVGQNPVLDLVKSTSFIPNSPGGGLAFPSSLTSQLPKRLASHGGPSKYCWLGDVHAQGNLN